MKYMQLFTHNDLDGVGCSVLATLAAAQSGYYLEVAHCSVAGINNAVTGWLDNTFIEPKFEYLLLIADISVSEAVAKRLEQLTKRNKNVRVQLLDHHEAEPTMLRRPWVRVETAQTHCGTTLMYDYLTSQRLLRPTDARAAFAEDVCLYDTWRFNAEAEEAENPERLNLAFWLMGKDAFIQTVSDRLTDPQAAPVIIRDWPEVNLFVENSLAERKLYCSRKAREMQTTQYKGYTIGYVYAEEHVSELAHCLLTEHPDIDIAAIIIMPGNVALRTNREDINLGTGIARALGGGGHAQAAGYRIQGLTEEITRQLLRFD